MDIPTKGVRIYMVNSPVGALSGLDGQGGMMRHVTEHIRATNKAAYGAAMYKNKRNVLPLVAVTRPRWKTKKATELGNNYWAR
jgi:hypothetical protein